MQKTLKRISVLKAGVIMAIMYAFLAVLIIPFFLLATIAGRAAAAAGGHSAMPFAALGVGFAIFLPIIYGVVGFIAGVLMSALYNLIAGWVGGLELVFEEPAGAAS